MGIDFLWGIHYTYINAILYFKYNKIYIGGLTCQTIMLLFKN